MTVAYRSQLELLFAGCLGSIRAWKEISQSFSGAAPRDVSLDRPCPDLPSRGRSGRRSPPASLREAISEEFAKKCLVPSGESLASLYKRDTDSQHEAQRHVRAHASLVLDRSQILIRTMSDPNLGLILELKKTVRWSADRGLAASCERCGRPVGP